jgi:hypothetical protein
VSLVREPGNRHTAREADAARAQKALHETLLGAYRAGKPSACRRKVTRSLIMRCRTVLPGCGKIPVKR